MTRATSRIRNITYMHTKAFCVAYLLRSQTRGGVAAEPRISEGCRYGHPFEREGRGKAELRVESAACPPLAWSRRFRAITQARRSRYFQLSVFSFRLFRICGFFQPHCLHSHGFSRSPITAASQLIDQRPQVQIVITRCSPWEISRRSKSCSCRQRAQCARICCGLFRRGSGKVESRK